MAIPHSKFEVSSFNSSCDIWGSQNSKSKSNAPFPTPFDLILHLFVSPFHVLCAITFESIDVGSSYLHICYISMKYGSCSYISGQGKDHRSKKVENPYPRNLHLAVTLVGVGVACSTTGA